MELQRYLIPMGNFTLFTQKVINLANDYELRKQIGMAAKNNSSRFSPPRIEKLWNSMLSHFSTEE